ncbi:GNAT family N-acetyltransferase [Pseudoroseomonas globiformis]|uniref:GNAT family N-acetyltransferase n=1 Tax=Teichococcus globiformis TaxID=2307229 RepID=A0ABV7G0F4_9PROT
MLRIAAQVHQQFPEGETVFAERLALHPEGCRMLEEEGAALGYAIAHPWRFARPPALDSLLGALPERPDTYYLHDAALLPAARGQGAARTLVELMRADAGSLPSLSLVAVGGTAALWARLGFTEHADAALLEKLASYGPAARFMARFQSG